MNRFLLGTTKLQIRIIGGKFKEVTVVKHPDGHDQEVAVFTSNNRSTGGMISAVNTIIFQEWVFQSERVLNRGIVHEGTHKKELHFLIYYLAVLLPLGLWFALGWVGVLVAFIVCFALLWLTEFRAECQVIRTFGIQAVLEDLQEYLALAKLSPLDRIVVWVLHPPESLVIMICRLLHKDVH